jgi:predicted Mrr-cat superfamily restriction endonuclease
MVRADKGGRKADEFRTGGFVAVGEGAEKLGRVDPSLSQEALRALLANVLLDASQADLTKRARRMHDFLTSIVPGDLVLTSALRDGTCPLGILGDLYWAGDDAHLPWRRHVQWVSSVPRSAISPETKAELDSLGKGTIFTFSGEAAAELNNLAAVPDSAPELSADDEPLGALEGEARTRMATHRRRERRLRQLKIAQALARNHGRLPCEVPGCGFDFETVYGPIGRGYAHVHHLDPLGERAGNQLTTLDDLIVVCANCHAMIHVGGQCRATEGLIKPDAKNY